MALAILCGQYSIFDSKNKMCLDNLPAALKNMQLAEKKNYKRMDQMRKPYTYKIEDKVYRKNHIKSKHLSK